MGDVFCLVMLESGSRRKLKLETGSYDELLAGLAGIAEVDFRNTLIQIFDTDLEDFVDLLPGDVVPNKAKVRIITKNEAAPSTAAASPVKAVLPSHPLPQAVHQVAPRHTASRQVVSQLPRKIEVLPYNLKSSVEDVPDNPAVHSEEVAVLTASAESEKAKEPEDTAVRLSRVTEDLRAMLPSRPGADDLPPPSNMTIIPKHEHDRKDYLKFKLPPSFGVWCDIALERKALITPKMRRHIIFVLFQACYKITLYPTMRLYRRAIDSLVVKYPHLAEGPFNWQCWNLALRSKFKNVRRRLPETPGLMGESRRKFGGKRTLDDVRYQVAKERMAYGVPALTSSELSGCHNQSGEDDSVDTEVALYKAKSEERDKEATVNCANLNNTVLEDVTVSDLLGMCTNEAAAEKLVEQAGGRALADEEMSDGGSSLEGSQKAFKTYPDRKAKSLEDRDDMKFELPSFGVFEESLRTRQQITSRLRRHIITCLFEACSKITLYPTSHLYRTAVDLLLHKYPHLIDTTGETGRELWVDSLKSKFKNVRRRLPDNVWSMSEVRSKYSTSARRATILEKQETEGVRRVSRPVTIEDLLAAGDNISQQSGPKAPTDTGSSNDRSQVLAVKERHDSIREMTVQQAIAAFPSYRQESALLAEFKTLWNTDIAECFEKGIKRLFLVLMNSGTEAEIQEISQAGNDILLVVLGVVAQRALESLDALLTEGSTLPTPCLVKRPTGNIDVFVNEYYLFTASSLLGGMCALFASFWVFHIEYPKEARNILTFLEHAFLNLRHTKPRLRCRELVNLYRSTHP
ncbi:uncharacterized protein LOC119453305 isoform X4 [Dermacentor silvarum]|uniref:uncharacterized protein LOC119453305 isoform X4 n=1 Tax=Dermacentor silvarum TaxID=543639 RepID=UPI0021012AD1|nr:uncharacterized protein LOC119453305 isoform X4 [Dermacentor silvarum]